MKAILYACLISIFLFGYPANSQQFAMDFSRFDCDSVEHHLFSELDEGKVIILDFVMLAVLLVSGRPGTWIPWFSLTNILIPGGLVFTLSVMRVPLPASKCLIGAPQVVFRK